MPLFRPDLRARWIAVLLAALLAFVGQSFLTQTHLHIGADAHAAVLFGKTAPAQLNAGQSSDEPASCPVCQEIAHAGQYLSSASALFQAPLAITLWRAVTALPALTRRQRSHAWQSRAPPHQLQA